MFVELIELLRCPNTHDETPLIAAAERTENRYVVQGTLGCPVCRAEFRIIDGVAHFGAAPPTPLQAPDAELALRLAAFLELHEARRPALLCGTLASQADQVARIASVPLVLLNAPDDAPGDAVANIRTDTAFPFAAGALHAAALDDAMPRALADAVARSVRSGGRIAGPSSLPLPEGAREIVRDDRMWVAEKIAAPSEPAPRLVTLKRA